MSYSLHTIVGTLRLISVLLIIMIEKLKTRGCTIQVLRNQITSSKSIRTQHGWAPRIKLCGLQRGLFVHGVQYRSLPFLLSQFHFEGVYISTWRTRT